MPVRADHRGGAHRRHHRRARAPRWSRRRRRSSSRPPRASTSSSPHSAAGRCSASVDDGDRRRDPRAGPRQARLAPRAHARAPRASPARARLPQRIGLSATQRPIEHTARLLGGCRYAGARRPSSTAATPARLDVSHRAARDRALGASRSTEQLGEVIDRIAAHVARAPHHARVRQHPADVRAPRPPPRRAARRGAGGRAPRQPVRGPPARAGGRACAPGDLRALVATASLELGIDIGPVELVCQVGSPRAIATFLQRVGRSNHSRRGMPEGILYPMTRDELVECAALLAAVRGGRLDATSSPRRRRSTSSPSRSSPRWPRPRSGPRTGSSSSCAARRPTPTLARADFDAVRRARVRGHQHRPGTAHGLRAPRRRQRRAAPPPRRAPRRAHERRSDRRGRRLPRHRRARRHAGRHRERGLRHRVDGGRRLPARARTRGASGASPRARCG